MKKGKEKKKGEPKYYFTIEYKNGEPGYVPYQWKSGEKEEYERTCLATENWCGIPMDVNWAKSAQPYMEAQRRMNEQ